MNGFSWDDLRYFLAVAETGSFSAAAKQLQSNQPTVGRHVKALEVSLGVRLFNRTRAGLTLTREGSRVLEHAESVRDGLAAIGQMGDGRRAAPQGSVRVALPEGLCTEVVVPRLEPFYREYPLVRLILNVSFRTTNLTRGEADLAIRLVRPKEPSVIARRLGTTEVVAVASRAYLKRRGAPRGEPDLEEHFAIAYGDELHGAPENRWLLEHVPPGQVVLQSDSATARRVAAESGLGIAILPSVILEGNDRLVPILRDVKLPPRDIWLIYHRDLKDVQRVRVVRDFLASLFRTDA